MKKRIMPMLLGTSLMLSIIFQPMNAEAAIQKMTVDKKEYSLHIEELPSFTSEWDTISAKLTNVSDSSSYALSILDDTDSSDVLTAGLKKVNISADPDNVYGVEISINKMDSEGEYHPAENTTQGIIICPVPDFWIDSVNDLSLYEVTSSGKAETVSYDLVEVDSIPCMKFDINSKGIYGFVLNTPEDETSGTTENSNQPENLAKASEPSNYYASVPANNAPNQEPEVAANVPPITSTNNSVAANNSIVDQTTKEVMNASPQKTEKQHKLDTTPQTGDSTPTELYTLSAALSATAMLGILMFLKRR